VLEDDRHLIVTLALPGVPPEAIELRCARGILDEDHYGLDKVKRRILEYLAVRKLNPEERNAILCLAGPPGVGKTSLGRSIARMLGLEFQRLSPGRGLPDRPRGAGGPRRPRARAGRRHPQGRPQRRCRHAGVAADAALRAQRRGDERRDQPARAGAAGGLGPRRRSSRRRAPASAP
jgi:hypothetical protein